MTEQTTGRRVVAWVSLSIDGYSSGPKGPEGDAWLHEKAMLDSTCTYFEGIWRGADTAVLGRTNYEGFYSVWPGITRDPASSDRIRAIGQWLDSVEKVVISKTLTEAKWENSRVASDLESTVRELKAAPGRDIMVLNSASIIQALLKAGLVDDLRFMVMPTIVGGGLRLFSEGLPESNWELADSVNLSSGVIALHYEAQN